MLLARALKLASPSEWLPGLHVCGLTPESVVNRSGLPRRPKWKKRYRELNRISRQRLVGPGGDYNDGGRQRDELAVAGVQWAEDDSHPLEQFVHNLHGMF